jgi:hypothetical protein
MKRLFIILLAVLLLALCACDSPVFPSTPDDTQSLSTTQTTTAIASSADEKQTSTEVVSTTTRISNVTNTRTTATSRADLNFRAIAAYNKYIKNRDFSIAYLSDDVVNAYYYSLYDVDGNGVDELLLGVNSVNFGKYLCDMCFMQNELVQQEAILSGGEYGFYETVIFEDGTIKVAYNIDGGMVYRYYKLEDENLRQVIALIDNTIEEDYPNYSKKTEMDGSFITITKEEFDRLKTEYDSNGAAVKFTWKPLSEFGKELGK